MKLLIIGDGRHGKDTVAEMLAERGLSFKSSSYHCLHRAIMPATGDTLPLYSSEDQCYEDRINHRDEWKRLISEYNTPKDRLVKEILEEHDVYVGLRKRDEFEAAKSHFDCIVWVDRSAHLPPEESNDMTIDDADLVVDNNSSLSELKINVGLLFNDLQELYND